jgi:uncharacterized membrane protein YphA (DoxX/SURF4 family)
MKQNPLPFLALWALRIALAVSFLSAVADRFGMWGPPGAPGVSWGTWANFLAYNAKVNSFLPRSLADLLGGAATAAELIFALWLLSSWKTRLAAFGAAGLLLLVALAMTLSFGIKAPLNYSVFTAAAAALALASFAPPSGASVPSARSVSNSH